MPPAPMSSLIGSGNAVLVDILLVVVGERFPEGGGSGT